MAELGWSVGRIGEIVGGRVAGDSHQPIDRVVTDSRKDVRGALFVALRGERFDGHDFVSQAVDGGAAAVMVESDAPGISAPRVVVGDTLEALQCLGLARRREFAGPVAAITGSSGKTTTRRLLAAVLEQRLATHQPPGNFNNHVGLPLTLLGLAAGHGAAVLELGCSGFGEIALLTRLSEPDLGLVTNVGPAHLEQLGDLEGVARAKGELFAGLGPDATCVVNQDDGRVAAMESRCRRRVTYGGDERAQVRLVGRRSAGPTGQLVGIDLAGRRVETRLRLLGVHNAANALAAAAAAMALGFGGDEIATGLAVLEPTPGRLAPRVGPAGALVIDDTYNANPASIAAELQVLAEVAPAERRIAVLGDMLELGQAAEGAHLEVGRLAADLGLALLVTVGEGGAAIGRGAVGAGLDPGLHRRADDHARAAALVRERVGEGFAVLVKGSRGMRMENVLHELVEGDH